jgi:carbamoylphosphate synthase large subunit
MSITAMFSYNQFSEGGKELADALSIPRIKHSGSKFKATSSKTLLNWGATSDRFPKEYLSCRVLNPPSAVDNAVDKIRSFDIFKAAKVSIPEFTTNRQQAIEWLNAGSMVFARTQLRAHSGRGIVIMDPEFPETWEVTAPLFVKYVPKKDEYRIHVMRGQVVDIQRKGLKAELQGTEGVNFKIRNLANGFIYTRNDNAGMALILSASVPQNVKEVAVQAVAALSLDFGAADIIWNDKQKKAYCLEVNTAPGLSGSTITNYAEAMAGF